MTCQVKLNNLNEWIIFEVCIQNKKGYIVSLSRSPNQTHDEYNTFLLNFEEVLPGIITRNLLFVLATCNLNASATNWWRKILKVLKGTQVNSFNTFYGFS